MLCVNVDCCVNMTRNKSGPWISAAEAAAALRVSRATLYAYVSRGRIRSQPTAGASRERVYSREDVDGLRRRAEIRRDPEKAAARALQWGVPVLESSITLIDGNRLYYRGHDAVALARARSVEEVASLIWTGALEPTFAINPVSVGPGKRQFEHGMSFVGRAQSALAAASGRDPLAFDLQSGRAALCGWRILRLLTAVATGSRPEALPIDRTLARAWRVTGRGADVLRAALILCADHELNVSSFTARSVASAGSNPYAVVIAGLAALEGTRHGGAGARVESMLAALRRARDLPSAVAARLRRGESMEGFGHPLYPRGDPRATLLLDQLNEWYGKSGELRYVLDFAAAAREAGREEPNVDYALAAVARVLRLPPGSALTLFAIGRTIGWIGHAIEQYATGQLIRPRARYVGVAPGSPG
jgi:citrate synthase